ncbi:MAG: hypothetical protein C0505_09950 [Leptothrix sp. (in: Bacteria)]|nr:hypothetical protein [Leptothrix sp. (in: b-proteobacteria)]
MIQGKAGTGGLPTLPAMRRLVSICLLVLMLCLGLGQGAWATPLPVRLQSARCAVQVLAPTVQAPSQEAEPHLATAGDATQAAGERCCETDCGQCQCQGPGLAALIGVPVPPRHCRGGTLRARSVCGAPDHIPELSLRPPLPPA